jgi:hypothetical protein
LQDHAPARQRLADVAGEKSVFEQGHHPHGAVAVALFGDEADPQPAALDRVEMAGGDAVDDDVFRLAGEDLAGQRVHQLGLAVAGDPGDAEYLAARDREGHVLQIGAELPARA